MVDSDLCFTYSKRMRDATFTHSANLSSDAALTLTNNKASTITR